MKGIYAGPLWIEGFRDEGFIDGHGLSLGYRWLIDITAWRFQVLIGFGRRL